MASDKEKQKKRHKLSIIRNQTEYITTDTANIKRIIREYKQFCAHLVKNTPAMRKTWVPSLAWEDALKKGKATYLSILAWKIPWNI